MPRTQSQATSFAETLESGGKLFSVTLGGERQSQGTVDQIPEKRIPLGRGLRCWGTGTLQGNGLNGHQASKVRSLSEPTVLSTRSLSLYRMSLLTTWKNRKAFEREAATQ